MLLILIENEIIEGTTTNTSSRLPLTDQNILVAIRCRKYQSQTNHMSPTYLPSTTNQLDTGPIHGMAYDGCHKQKICPNPNSFPFAVLNSW